MNTLKTVPFLLNAVHGAPLKILQIAPLWKAHRRRYKLKGKCDLRSQLSFSLYSCSKNRLLLCACAVEYLNYLGVGCIQSQVRERR